MRINLPQPLQDIRNTRQSLPNPLPLLLPNFPPYHLHSPHNNITTLPNTRRNRRIANQRVPDTLHRTANVQDRNRMIKRFALAILHVLCWGLFENSVGDGVFGAGVYEAVEIGVALLPENVEHNEAGELGRVGA